MLAKAARAAGAQRAARRAYANDLAYKSQIALQKGDRTTAYNLDNLLDQQPGSEAQLIASGEVWQIAAFAALYTEKISKSLPWQRSGGEGEEKQTYREKHF
jgi:hypothetical protein